MFKYALNLTSFCVACLIALSSYAGGREDFNDCRTSAGDFCERAGSCAIQGSAWYQYVTIYKKEKFDTQGWPGLCDMIHVSLVQGNCIPTGAQSDITSYLSSMSYANIPNVSGTLTCGGGGGDGGTTEPEEICNDGIDNDLNGKIDCEDKGQCRRDSYCR